MSSSILYYSFCDHMYFKLYELSCGRELISSNIGNQTSGFCREQLPNSLDDFLILNIID